MRSGQIPRLPRAAAGRLGLLCLMLLLLVGTAWAYPVKQLQASAHGGRWLLRYPEIPGLGQRLRRHFGPDTNELRDPGGTHFEWAMTVTVELERGGLVSLLGRGQLAYYESQGHRTGANPTPLTRSLNLLQGQPVPLKDHLTLDGRKKLERLVRGDLENFYLTPRGAVFFSDAGEKLVDLRPYLRRDSELLKSLAS